MSEFLRPLEACAMLGVSRSTLRRLEQQRVVFRVQLGKGLVRYSRAGLLKAMQRREGVVPLKKGGAA